MLAMLNTHRHTLTEVVSIGGLFVLVPANRVVFVQVVVTPDFSHVLVNVSLLNTFNPKIQFIGGDEPISISIDTIHNLTVSTHTHNYNI